MIYLWASLLVVWNAVGVFLTLLSLPGTWLMVLATVLLAWWQWDVRMFSPWTLGIVVGLAVVVLTLTALAPHDVTLKRTSPIVYLHGALVWTAMLAFSVAGLVGLAGLVWRREVLHAWSGALARTGLFFWVIYLPLGMWASKASWNAIPLDDPRFRVAFQVLVLAAGFQIAAALWGNCSAIRAIRTSASMSAWAFAGVYSSEDSRTLKQRYSLCVSSNDTKGSSERMRDLTSSVKNRPTCSLVASLIS